MTQISSLVKSAMGFDQARGDQVQVTNMQFARVIDMGELPQQLVQIDYAELEKRFIDKSVKARKTAKR